MKASPPPAGLPGLRPEWSRLVSAEDADGVLRTWHVLDSHARKVDSPVRQTLVCVHGNPTWSYLWRSLVEQAPHDVRVIAIDQLDMGFSERTKTVRRLERRVADLDAVLSVLAPDGPVVLVAHDWGGPVALGWAVAHHERVEAIALSNTAVHQPDDALPPAVIRLARARGLLRIGTKDTSAFLDVTLALSRHSMTPDIRRAFKAPYRSASRREAIADFVADIPLEPDHPSRAYLDHIASETSVLADVPVLLQWGPADPVFSGRYLADLERRMPHAAVHRYEGAGHLVIEDAPDFVADLLSWLKGESRTSPTRSAAVATDRIPLWAELDRRATTTPGGLALAEPHLGGWRQVTWSQLREAVDSLARGLSTRGVKHGDRVSVLVPPGANLIALVYACWRIGASVVVTDSGLGARGIHRALRGARPDVVIGIPKAMALVRGTGITGRRIPVRELAAIARDGRGSVLPPEPSAEDEAIVAFTSGSTGPAKGVVYRHGQIEATRDLLRVHYSIGDDDALVAAFAPWAVLGPALGIASAIPDMDVTSPRTLQARALAQAAMQVEGTLVWASPAAFASILRTADRLTSDERQALAGLRLVLGAGAPVSQDLLEGMSELCPGAEVRTPYGMTEVLPVCDVTLADIRDAGFGPGVLVGRPLPGVSVRISAVDAKGIADELPTAAPNVLGEVVVQADHRKDRYDRLHFTEARSSRDSGWHRTGDVGELDQDGRLWIAGRLAHVITTAQGPVAPVPIEQRVQQLAEIDQAACVGVGPVGAQVIVVVITSTKLTGSVVPLDLLDRVRAVAGSPVAAVLVRDHLPVDIRHNSKIDRSALARWADQVLEGGR